MGIRDCLYVMFDVETTGPDIRRGSLVSVAAVAFKPAEFYIPTDTFRMNVELTPSDPRDPDTMRWWSKFPQMWHQNTVDPRPRSEVASHLVSFLRRFPDFVPVAYPAAFDAQFVQDLLRCAEDADEFFDYKRAGGWSWFCAHTYATSQMKDHHLQCRRSKWPKYWSDETLQVTHDPLDDCHNQAYALNEMFKGL